MGNWTEQRILAWNEYLKTDAAEMYRGWCRCPYCSEFRDKFEAWYAARIDRKEPSDAK